MTGAEVFVFGDSSLSLCDFFSVKPLKKSSHKTDLSNCVLLLPSCCSVASFACVAAAIPSPSLLQSRHQIAQATVSTWRGNSPWAQLVDLMSELSELRVEHAGPL